MTEDDVQGLTELIGLMARLRGVSVATLAGVGVEAFTAEFQRNLRGIAVDGLWPSRLAMPSDADVAEAYRRACRMGVQ